MALALKAAEIFACPGKGVGVAVKAAEIGFDAEFLEFGQQCLAVAGKSQGSVQKPGIFKGFVFFRH